MAIVIMAKNNRALWRIKKYEIEESVYAIAFFLETIRD